MDRSMKPGILLKTQSSSMWNMYSLLTYPGQQHAVRGKARKGGDGEEGRGGEWKRDD